MPVQKIFWDDPYLTRLDEAKVMRVRGDQVYLDRTIAFAESGGQESDAGTIAGRQILEARKEDLDIAYRLTPDHGLAAGDAAPVEIDWERRWALMRLHFSAELVLELINQHYGRPEKTGAHIAQDKARLDFVWDGKISDAFPVLEVEIARLVAADLAIQTGYGDVERQKRFWRVEGLATVPCGGTHPRRTSEIGRVLLKRENPGKGRERIEVRLG